MYTKPLLLSVAVLFSASAFSQSATFSSAESLGRSGTGVTMSSTSSVYLNPAGLAKQKHTLFSADYLFPYYLPDLSVRQVSGILSTGYGTIFSMVRQFGVELYHENEFSFGFSKSLSNRLRCSFQLNYFQICQSEQKGGQYYASCGFQYDIWDHFVFGAFIVNPEKSNVSIDDEVIRINNVYHFGLLWKVASDVCMMYEMEQISDFSLIHLFGFEYDICKVLCVRAGVKGKPLNYSIGAGIKVGKFVFDSGVLVHEVLGVSSAFGLTYKIN